jgi:hypothetical protein
VRPKIDFHTRKWSLKEKDCFQIRKYGMISSDDTLARLKFFAMLFEKHGSTQRFKFFLLLFLSRKRRMVQGR